MKFVLKWVLSLCALTVVAIPCANGQSVNAADLRGTVTDQSGAVLPGATVTVLNLDTGVSNSYVTNSQGVYDTSSIVVGRYKVTFTTPGFQTLVRGPVTLQVGSLTLNAQLKVGSASQQVTVTADVPLLQTDTGAQSTTLESKSMTQLPQVTESWENFMILLPGSSGAPGASQGSSNPGQEVSVNGNLPYNNILADGASTTLSHSQNANPAIFETVAELQVNTSSFSAQYGVGGVIMNQITKGGTDKFHGEAYEFMQNDAFNAYPYEFGASRASIGPIPFLRYNNFGGNIGGPIIRKHMFFFFDYDQIVNHGTSTGRNSVPTTALMGGDFTGLQAIFDPTTQTIAHDAQGNPYPVRRSFASEYGANVIPASLFDALAAKMQGFYPTPSSHIPGGAFVPGTVGSEGETQNNFYSSLRTSAPFRRFFGRFDWDITGTNRLTASDTQSDTPQFYPSNVTACPIGCQSGDVDNNNAQVTDVWNMSPRTINEARMGFTSQLNFFVDQALNKGYPASLGWSYAKANTIPAINYTGTYPFAWIDPSSNAVYKIFTWDPSDVVTMIRGKHILHFGGELLAYQDNATAWGNSNAGSFYFSGQYTQQWAVDPATGVAGPVPGTGMEYADFLLGDVNSWNAATSPEYGARLKQPQMFIQDDWKMRPNFTLNLGLRYQINHGWNEVHNNMASFDSTILNPTTGTGGAYWFGTTHLNGRTSLQADNLTTFQPRVGFSWLAYPNITFRGGVGVYSYIWSLDAYGGDNTTYGMGAALSASGSLSDQSNGITPVTTLGGAGTVFGTATPLPFTALQTPDSHNGQNAGYIQYHTPVPRIVQWTFGMQHALTTDLMYELNYVASHGSGLIFNTDINAVPENALSAGDALSCGTGTTAGCARPYPIYQAINGSTNDTETNYHSMQASITKRMRNGVSLNFNYTWSHMMDDQDSAGWGSRGGPQTFQQAHRPGANYSNSNFDVRHAFKGYAVYQLPIGKGHMFLNKNALVDAVIGGWEASGTLVLSTGNPFSVLATQNTYQQAGAAFPNWNPAGSVRPAHRSIDSWFNPEGFLNPPNGTFGNVRRNSLYGPGTELVNLSASKTFHMYENLSLQIRGDAMNAFNHASFGVPGDVSVGGSAGPGTAYTTGTTAIRNVTVGGRNLQLGARLTF